jgi:ribonucleoside-diphosphate reductase alpha chain
MDHLTVIKRDGHRENVSFDKILARIRKLADGLEHVNPDIVAQKVCTQLKDGMHTSELDEFAAETCAMMQARYHPNYGKLAARIVVDNHHKNTPDTLLECTKTLGDASVIAESHLYAVVEQTEAYQAMIDYSRDFLFDYFGFKTLEKSYLLRVKGKVVERPQHLWMRVAIQLHGSDLEKVQETYDALSQGYFIHATPTLFNAGTARPQLSSCFLLQMSDDSIQGIYKTLGDCAQISKWAGGIGLNVHNIRAEGAHIQGTNGKATGLVPMLRVFNDTARYVNQGGKRNGSFAIYLEPWHADIEAFLRLKLNQGAEEERARDLFYGLWIPDLFMKRVESNGMWTLFSPDEAPGLADCWGPKFEDLYMKYEQEGKGRKTMPAQKLWQMVLDAQIQTGTPYLCYKDAANSKSNQQNLGTIKCSNLCVAPETLVLTKTGNHPIRDLADQEHEVWNGAKWSKTTIRKTGESQRLVTVNLSNGASITCTPYHKFLVHEGYADRRSIKDSVRVDASDLKEGMTLKKFIAPVVENGERVVSPYTHGFFCGDGTVSGKSKTCALYGEKKKLVPFLDIKSMSGVEDAHGRLNTVLNQDISEKFVVPIRACLADKLAWLAGLADADGSIARNGDNESLQISSIYYRFLDDIRIMLLSMGVHAKVVKMCNARLRDLPDGRGGYAEYVCKPIWRLLVSSSGLYTLASLGFETHRLTFDHREPQRNAEQFVRVMCVVDTGRVDDTYCFNEPENHAGVFNGVLTGNCTEIMEFTSKEESAVCNLGSLSLPKFIKEDNTFDFHALGGYTKILTRNLDLVIDKNYYPTPECERSNVRNRPIGIGVQGLADVFARLRLPWQSEGARKLNRKIFETIYYWALAESLTLAKEKGSYPSHLGSPLSSGKLQCDLWKDSPTETPELDWAALRETARKWGARNSLLIAPMPTASTSQILGNNECFEPFTSNLYSRRVLAGEFMIVNKYLVDDLTKLNLWTPEIRTEIMANNGSVQNILAIPSELRELYKTAWELPMKTIIQMARDRAPFICQSQSLNLFVADPTYSKLSSMHFFAWREGLKTGCYYLRTKAASSAQKFTVEPPKQEECLSCAA